MNYSENFEKIAISSRIRLARNVSGFNFFTKLHQDDAVFIISCVSKALDRFGGFDITRLKNLSLNECNALLERHIISKELVENKDISAVAVSSDEHLIVMLNEEDHIREQCIMSGFNLVRPYREIKLLDRCILSEVNVARSDEFGYLTSSPANVGTAMRASVMLFLPAVERNLDIKLIIDEARQKGFTLRGLYGEGSENFGSFYQISNQNSFLTAEEQIIDRVGEYVFQICQMELSAREDILASNHDKLLDEIYRAYGTLSSAYMLSERETIELLSLIKFGDALGFLEIVDQKKFDNLQVESGSANLKELSNFENFLDKSKEDIARAEYIKKNIKQLVKMGR